MKTQIRICRHQHNQCGVWRLLKRGVKFILPLVVLLSLLPIPAARVVSAATVVTFTGPELVGNPTDSSITINIIPDANIEYHYQYGTTSGDLSSQTDNFSATGGQPDEQTITGLTANTRYYYRMRYHAPGDGEEDWVVRDEYSFMTQRAEGTTFVFTVTADSHNATATNTNFTNSMQKIATDQPDFHIDIGDTQFAEFERNASIQSKVDTAYKEYRATTHFGAFGHSSPVFLSSGNHEEEEGWNLDDSWSRGIANIQARKAFFPTPINGSFYSGNTDPLAAIDETIYGDELRENYYAWEWGDALFVVIDPFQYTPVLPYPIIAGEEGDETVTTSDQWVWTLGEQQYEWLAETLRSSAAKYKFMFSHQMVGGIPDNSVSGAAGYVRGGAEAAGYFEWGGKNFNGTEDFETERSTWEKPIHDLMVETGVSAYFHGHDHQYVYEKRDGIVYHEVPSPSMTGSGFSGIYSVGSHTGYETIAMCPSPGYLRITVSPTQALVEYVNPSSSVTCNPTSFTRSYSIPPNGPITGILGDVDQSGSVNSTDALIILSGDVGLDVAEFCPMNCGDVNADGFVNSTDALAVLSFDVGISVPFPMGDTGCPTSITQPPGCSP